MGAPECIVDHTPEGRVGRFSGPSLGVYTMRCTVLTATPWAGRDHADTWPTLLAQIGEDRVLAPILGRPVRMVSAPYDEPLGLMSSRGLG